VADSRPRVSVIIPTKDRPQLLEQALASAAALRGDDLDLELIVADNGSVADIEAIARCYGAKFTVTLTPGPSAARNAGLAVATGEFVAFLDDDDLWTRKHIRSHLTFLSQHQDFAAVVSQVVRTDMEGNPTSEPYPDRMPADGRLFKQFLLNWHQIGALVARTEVIQALGGFDEALPAGEDWDLFLRLAISQKIGFVPVPTVLFRARPAANPREDDVTRFRAGVNARVFRKNVWRAKFKAPAPHIVVIAYLRYLGLYAGYLMGNSSVYLEQGNKPQARRAVLSAFRTSPIYVLGCLTLRRYWRRVILQALF
jgi:glycosyltransferase involved in cell wall biosynthesis